MSVCFTRGDKEEAIGVMREAAQWLIDTDRPLWDADDLSYETLTDPPDAFHVMWETGESAAAMILSFEDRLFWPDMAPNTSGFVHKLCVRRKFAGKGYAKRMIEHAVTLCLDRGVRLLRLDCDAHRKGLLRFYESCGFVLAEMKQMDTQKWGTLDLALYEMRF